MLDDIDTADRRHGEATTHALELWQRHWPNDVLVSIPGLGPVCASAIRGWWGDAVQFRSARAAAAHTGLTPSVWSSGQTIAPSRQITKQGPAELRLALYRAANVARRRNAQLAEHYRRLMTERGHNHISATTAVARKLACRAWKIATTGQPYQPRDLDGNHLSLDLAAELAVADHIRARTRGHTRRGRLSTS
ncbi:MAG: transposase [Acidimicrobiales bacterium]